MSIFLWVDGIRGASKKPGHSGETEVFSYSFGVANRGSIAMGPSSAGARFMAHGNEMEFVKQQDAGTGEFVRGVADALVYARALLTQDYTVGGKAGVLRYEMTNVTVSSVRPGSSKFGDPNPLDYIGLMFEEIKFGSSAG